MNREARKINGTIPTRQSGEWGRVQGIGLWRISALLIVAVFCTLWTTQTVTAQDPICDCESDGAIDETEPEDRGWGSGSTRTPEGLQRTAGGGGVGGAGGPIDLCEQETLFIPPDNSDVWVVNETDFQLMNRMFERSAYLYIAQCGPIDRSASSRVQLIEPNGIRHTLMPQPEYDDYGPIYQYLFSIDDVEGDYTLIIDSTSGYWERTISLHILDYLTDRYSGPRFYLYDAGAGVERNEFVVGEELWLSYSNYQADVPVEVALYGLEEGDGGWFEYTVINSWVIRTDDSGEYSEWMTIPPGTPPGRYVLAAMPIRSFAEEDAFLQVLEPFDHGTMPGGAGTYFYRLFDVASVVDSVLRIENSGSSDVCAAYVRSAGSGSWGDNRLGRSRLKPGQLRTVELPTGDYDLYASNCDGELIEQHDDVRLSGTMTWSLEAEAELDPAILLDALAQRIVFSTVDNDYLDEAFVLAENLVFRLDEYPTSGSGVRMSDMIAALQREDGGDRINALVDEVWGEWRKKTDQSGLSPWSADPASMGFSPFRGLTIRLIQGSQGSLSRDQRSALHSYLTRKEDGDVWQGSIDGIIGAINREFLP